PRPPALDPELDEACLELLDGKFGEILHRAAIIAKARGQGPRAERNEARPSGGRNPLLLLPASYFLLLASSTRDIACRGPCPCSPAAPRAPGSAGRAASARGGARRS